MSSTTDILFNSPALQSLKRDQLVKLCKIHSIKATGKNSELVEKLKKYAESLPADAALRMSANEGPEDMGKVEGEDGTDESERRQSEQWELLEPIAELDENHSSGTMSSLKTMDSGNTVHNDFGTKRSKCASLISPSGTTSVIHISFDDSRECIFVD